VFIGHFAVGLASKRVAPRASLGTYFLAAQFLDLLWPTFLLLGLETVRIVPGITVVTPLDFTSYPYSHSLAAALGWSVLFALVYFGLRRNLRESVVLAICVLSHWVLDFVTHRPDLPLTLGGSVRVGLELWASRGWTLAVELSMFLAASTLYLRGTQARDRTGSLACWALLGFLLVAYFGAIFGPPPPSVPALGWGGQSVWLLVVWGYWVDRHRAAPATT